MTAYKNPEAWKKSMQLVKEVYILMELFPKQEHYGICPQAKRAAVSIPSNIAGDVAADISGIQGIFTYCERFINRYERDDLK